MGHIDIVVMAPHLVLFGHAAGYALFRVREFEEVAAFLPQVEEAISDVSKFSSVVNLIGFYPFKTAGDALSNINSVSEGIVSDDLKLFLETNMPKDKAVLGVSDSKLSSSINDACGIKKKKKKEKKKRKAEDAEESVSEP